jgi:hypothetical protein
VNPWEIIGWAICIVLALIVTRYVLRFVIWIVFAIVGAIAVRRLRNAALHITPRTGQKWQQRIGEKWSSLWIGRTFDNGDFIVRTSPREYGDGASWRESADEWRTRILTRDCHLIEEPKE